MASKNIEINIKNTTTDSSSSDTETYTTLYPKSLSKNIIYDTFTNVSVEDKLNNLSPNDTFELGDILCTSKINVDTEKWHLCDGSELDSSQYQDLFNVSLLKNISGLKDVDDTLKPSDLDLQGWWEINGYYFRYISESTTYTLYRCPVDADLTVKSNWESLAITNSYAAPEIIQITYLNDYLVLAGDYKIWEGSGDNEVLAWRIGIWLVDFDDFTLKKHDYKTWDSSPTSSEYIHHLCKPIYYSGAFHVLAEVTYNSHKSAYKLEELVYDPTTNRSTLNQGAFSTTNDYLEGYVLSESGYVIFTIANYSNSITTYTEYMALNPSQIWSYSSYDKNGWKSVKDTSGEEQEDVIYSKVGDYLFTINGNYMKNFSVSTSTSGDLLVEYNILDAVKGTPLCWTYDTAKLFTYDSTNKVLYSYVLNGEIFVLQYSLVNTKSYSLNGKLSPNGVPFVYQDSKYQELLLGLSLPQKDSTAQYNYYIKIKS